MELLVTYDVSTEDRAGRRRLRKVAKVCEAHGRRVQYSVFECSLDAAQHELFVHKLQEIIDEEHDSLRLYRLRRTREDHIQVLGREASPDLHDPLIV